MNLSQSFSMRMDQRQVLTPRMIQSMEILQLPLSALEERIDQELQVNPVLDVKTRDPDQMIDRSEGPDLGGLNRTESERSLVVNENADGTADFNRLDKLSEYLENEEFSTNATFSRSHWDGQDRDGKMDAMANAPSSGISLAEHLRDQWAYIDVPTNIKKAGDLLIDYVDIDGYIRTNFETIQLESKDPVTIEDLNTSIKLIHQLEPAGVGARNLSECLILQLDWMENDEEMSEGHDFDLERALVRDHIKDLEMNRYPLISKKLGVEMDEIKDAVKRLSRLQPHPGRQFSRTEAPPITPDAEIFFDDDTNQYEIKMSRDIAPSLYLKKRYLKMMQDKKTDKKTKEFLTNNARNAKWLIESVEQRRNTIQRVIRVVVDTQRDFFDQGPEHLKPLPMVNVADQLGIHVATVSRAVSEKWIQTPRGVFPLRRFFSGGTQSADGQDMSWDAVKEKLKIIIDNEDKQNPLNDDEIVEALKTQGIELARRTVAKYRKVLNIPTARQRVAY